MLNYRTFITLLGFLAVAYSLLPKMALANGNFLVTVVEV